MKELPQDAAEQAILRFLNQPVREAVNDYYDGSRQYWREEVFSTQKIAQSPYYEVVIRVETFNGPHNPPYGVKTMTFLYWPV